MSSRRLKWWHAKNDNIISDFSSYVNGDVVVDNDIREQSLTVVNTDRKIEHSKY